MWAEQAAGKSACNQLSEALGHWASEIPTQGSGAWSCTIISEGQLPFREQTETPKFSSFPKDYSEKNKIKFKKWTDLYQGWALHIAGRGGSCISHLNEMLIPILSFCRETPGPTGAAGCGSGVKVRNGTLRLQHWLGLAESSAAQGLARLGLTPYTLILGLVIQHLCHRVGWWGTLQNWRLVAKWY